MIVPKEEILTIKTISTDMVTEVTEVTEVIKIVVTEGIEVTTNTVDSNKEKIVDLVATKEVVSKNVIITMVLETTTEEMMGMNLTYLMMTNHKRDLSKKNPMISMKETYWTMAQAQLKKPRKNLMISWVVEMMTSTF
jgi:hypothetical protein